MDQKDYPFVIDNPLGGNWRIEVYTDKDRTVLPTLTVYMLLDDTFGDARPGHREKMKKRCDFLNRCVEEGRIVREEIYGVWVVPEYLVDSL